MQLTDKLLCEQALFGIGGMAGTQDAWQAPGPAPALAVAPPMPWKPATVPPASVHEEWPTGARYTSSSTDPATAPSAAAHDALDSQSANALPAQSACAAAEAHTAEGRPAAAPMDSFSSVFDFL